MITIHHEKETDFSKNGYGAIDDYVMGQEVTWEMNGQFYAYLEYPAFLDKSAYLVNKNILRVPVPFMEDQLFRIYRVRKVLGFIQVEARHIFYDLMDNLIEDTNIVGKTGSQAIQQLLGATQYEHRFIGFSDISTSNNARMVRYNPVEALLDDSKANTFVSRWGGEVVRDNFVIRMVRQMGTDRGVRIQHRKDLTAYIATIDESTVVTRIMPVGFDGLKLPELYIDSPLLDPDNPKIGVIRYENVKAAIGEYADDNGAVPLEEAYELLREHARAEFNTNHLDEPEMTVTVNFVTLHNTKEYADFAQLQEIHQGDVVRVSVPDEGFEITSRLVAFTSDPLQQNHYTSTTLGNHVYEFTSSTNSVSTLRNEVEALRESVVEVRQSANGKNQSFLGEADPNTLNLNAILGDTYFRSVGEEDVIYQYVEVDGERYWKEIINTANTSEVKKEVERVAEEAEKLADDITEAQQSADDAKRDAGLALTASEALEIITQETASQLSDTRGLLATVESNASEALSQASGAITQAGQAVLDAQTAMGDAQSALSKASGVESTVSTLSSEFDEVAGKVELKADKSEVDTLSGTVSTHTTTISQNATAISSKAEQSEVDTVKGTVSTHTSTLEQQAKEISARLTQSQVDNLVSDKGYSTVSYVDNKMSATAESIRTEMTAVEGKIPQSYTEENLVLNSKVYVSNTDYLIKEYDLVKELTVGKEYTIVLEGGIGAAGSDQQFGIYFDNAGSYQGSLVNIAGGIYKKTFTLLQTGLDSGDKSSFSLYNLPQRGASAVIKWIKLVEGKAKDNTYRPSMNELLMENDFTAFTTDFDVKAQGWDATTTYVSNNQTKINSLVSNADGWQNTISYVDNNKTKINQTISQVDSYAQTIGTNGEKIANMVMTDSMFSTRVLESIDIGGRNYALGTTDKMQYHQNVGAWSGSLTDNTSKTKYTLADLDAKVGDVYTASIYIGAGGGFGSGLRVDNQLGEKYRSNQLSGGYASVTFKVESSDTHFIFYYSNNSSTNQAYKIEACKFKIEKGNKRTDWSPAPEDMATSQQVSEIKQTADSVQALVGTTNDSVARAVMTSSLWETEVSKVIDDELEQEYKTVTSEVYIVDGGKGTNNGESYAGGRFFYFNNSDGFVQKSLQTYKTYKFTFSTQTGNNNGNTVILQVKQYGSTSWDSLSTGNMTSGQLNTTLTFKNSVFASSVSDYRLEIQDINGKAVPYIWGFKLYEEAEVQVPIESGKTGAISSKITQLYNMINLSVLGKEGALSRIAIGEEGIQIDGKLLHITAKTFIDDAVIKSAMIDTLDAGKITTGELNASLIRVVSLDANSISGNEASFITAMFTARHSALQITGDGITVSKTNGDRTFSVDSGGVRFYSDTGQGAYITTHDVLNWNGSSWVDTGADSVMFASELNHSIGIGYKIYSGGRYITRSAIRLDRTGSGTPELQINLPIENLIFSRGKVAGANGSYLRNNQNTAGIWFGDNGLTYLMESGSLYGSEWWKNK